MKTIRPIKLFAGGILAAISLALTCISSHAQSTNLMLYNFDTDQVTASAYGSVWGNWFGGNFVSVAWDSTTDASNNPSSGSMMLTINNQGSDQYLLDDGIPNGNPWTPTYAPVSLEIFTNLSFDMRYDVSSAIRTNTTAAGINGSLGPGSEDFGYMRVGVVGGTPGSVTWGQDWYYYWAISATNGAGGPNTNWIHMSIDLRQVSGAFGDLNSGINDFMFSMDNSSYGNNVLVGPQIIWIDNLQFEGTMPHYPPPTMSIQTATPSALWLFGGSGINGRSQVALVDDNATWIGGTFPVTYSFTILDNANSPGNMQTGIQFIGGGGDASYLDWGAANVLWLEIVSGTAPNTACVANVSWKTNFPSTNPNVPGGNIALTITNSVLAGTWTLTFLSDTNGTLTAPGNVNVNVPFDLEPLADADAIAAFSSPIQVRFGHENLGNAANGGVPHYWANITVSNVASGLNVNEDFTKEGTNQLDTTIWDLNTSDGVGVINLVPTNAAYWVKWNTVGDSGFALINGTSLTDITNWNAPANVPPRITQGGMRWQLIPSASLPAGPASFYALVQRTFSQLQVLLPGETNAPNTLTGKVGTPDPVSLGAGGTVNVAINAVDPTYHIVTTASGDLIGLTTDDVTATLPAPAALANGTVTEQLTFGSTGSFTVTATNMTNVSMPTATSSSVTVGP